MAYAFAAPNDTSGLGRRPDALRLAAPEAPGPRIVTGLTAGRVDA